VAEVKDKILSFRVGLKNPNGRAGWIFRSHSSSVPERRGKNGKTPKTEPEPRIQGESRVGGIEGRRPIWQRGAMSIRPESSNGKIGFRMA